MSSERPSYNHLSLTALLIGVPVLVGASYYYVYYSGTNNKNDKDKKNASGGNKKEAKQMSPLEELMHLKQIGNQNFSRKKYDIAIEHYTKAIELSQTITPTIKPDDLAIFYQNRAACNEALGFYEKVIDDCTNAIKLKPTYIKAYLRRAKAYEKLVDYDKAMVDAFSATLLEKFQNQASMILTDNIVKASSKAKAMEAMKTHTPTLPSNQTIKAYFSAFSMDPVQDKYGGAITSATQLLPLYEEAIKPENDNDPISLLIRGSCLSLMSDMKNAQVAFDKLLALNDEECSARIKSNALIKKAAIVISDSSSINSSIEKDFELVFELIEQAIKLDPENPDIYLHKAQALTLCDKFQEAIQTLDKAIELKNDLHSAIAQKIYIDFKLATGDSSLPTRKSEELLKKFQTAIKESPESQDLQQMYAQVLTEMSLFEQADQVLLNLSKLDPKDGSFHVSRALLQFHLKSDPDEVSVLLKEALKIDPKIIFAYEILGSIDTQQGKLDEAIKIFETAVKYASSESEYARCFGLLDSAKSQKTATELLGM